MLNLYSLLLNNLDTVQTLLEDGAQAEEKTHC